MPNLEDPCLVFQFHSDKCLWKVSVAPYSFITNFEK